MKLRKKYFFRKKLLFSIIFVTFYSQSLDLIEKKRVGIIVMRIFTKEGDILLV